MEMRKTSIKESFSNIFYVIFSPSKAFFNIGQRPRWVVAFLTLTVLSIFVGLINLTSVEKMIRIMLPSGMADIFLNTETNAKLLTTIITPSIMIIKCLLFTILIWLISGTMTDRVTFGKTYSLAFHTGILLFLEFFLVATIYFVKSLYQNLSFHDFKIYLGLDILFKGHEISLPFRTILANFNIINIWWVVVMILGLQKIFNISRRKSVLIVAIFWSVWLGIQIAIGLLFHLRVSNL
jgi:hypothetical protein